MSTIEYQLLSYCRICNLYMVGSVGLCCKCRKPDVWPRP